MVAENIAAGQETPQEVVTGWLRSPGHCKNIMGDFTRIGLSFMALAGYFAHESALDGSTPLRRAQATGARFQVVAENIAAGQETPQEVVTGWLRSP
ncbi:hypothetical protein CTI14_58765, partial [Methylobacterium radiotolerans]